MVRSLTCPALIFRATPLVKWAETDVGCKAIPNDFNRPSSNIETKAPVSTSRRPARPRIEQATVSAPFFSRRSGILVNFSESATEASWRERDQSTLKKINFVRQLITAL